jgi:crotonobetainyl-CoA:carnitine CoA-transferase CaiB-like acyl-CoA transferase
MSPQPSLPLAGVRVLDLTRALAGPFCTTLLADMGADVTKVESLTGDMIRGWGPFDAETSLYHLSVNRNKRSLAVDLRSPEGRALLRDLAARSDVLVENFKPGILAGLGLDPAVLAEELPELIVASVSGFGSVGPLRDDPGFDQIAQGMAGLMSVTGPTDGGPTRVGVPIADLLSGMFTAFGVAAALAGRSRTGGRVHVETSLVESVLGVLTFQAQRYLSLGEVPASVGNDHPVISPYGVFPTADAPLNIAIATEQQWQAFCDVVEAPGLAAHPDFVDGKCRQANRDALRVEIERLLRGRTSNEWLTLMRAAGLPVGPIHDMAGVFADEQVTALEMVTTVEHPALGQVETMRGPLRLNGVPVPVERAAPLLGQHTVEVLEELGRTPSAIEDLLGSGTVAASTRVLAASGAMPASAVRT